MDEGISAEQIAAAWQYERLFVPAVFQQWASRLTTAAGFQSTSHLLDVACGTGVVARAALVQAGSSGRVAGIDPAPGMLAVARELAPEIEWQLGTAQSLPFATNSFDCVVCQFGLMFFADRPQALQEMHRVLRNDGVAAVAVWDSLSRNPAYQDLVELLDRLLGPRAADAERIPFALGDADETVMLLADAGFKSIVSDTLLGNAAFPSIRHLVEAELRGWLPLFDIFVSDAEIDNVLTEADRCLADYVDEDGQARFPISVHVIRGCKSG